MQDAMSRNLAITIIATLVLVGIAALIRKYEGCADCDRAADPITVITDLH